MSIFARIFDSVFAPASAFDSASDACATSDEVTTGYELTIINSTTGLPMMDGIGSFDVGGSVFGQDVHHQEYFSANDSIFEDCGSMFDHGPSSFDTGVTLDCGFSAPDFGCTSD